MAVFNYKQTIYAGMIALAGVDGKVTGAERSLAKEIFNHNYDMSRSDRKEVERMWDKNPEGFTDLVIEELKNHSLLDQKEALKSFYHFIHERRKSYNLSGKSREKGVDNDLRELNLYDERVEEIRSKLNI